MLRSKRVTWSSPDLSEEHLEPVAPRATDAADLDPERGAFRGERTGLPETEHVAGRSVQRGRPEISFGIWSVNDSGRWHGKRKPPALRRDSRIETPHRGADVPRTRTASARAQVAGARGAAHDHAVRVRRSRPERVSEHERDRDGGHTGRDENGYRLLVTRPQRRDHTRRLFLHGHRSQA